MSGVVQRSTIDYVLVPHPFLDKVTQLRIVEDSGIHSDHRPLIAKMVWSPAGGVATRSEKSLHKSWRVHELDERGWHMFEEACDQEITDWLADFELASTEVGGDPQQLADSGFAAWLAAMNRAASATIGVKKVGATSKPFMTREVLSLMRMRKVAARALREVPPGKSHADERLALLEAKSRLRREIKSLKRKKLIELFRRIEGSGSDRILYKRWNARVKAMSSSESLPDSALNADGELVSDPVAVLTVWRDFYARLGKADTIADFGDHAESKRAGSGFDDDFARQVLQQLRSRCFDADGSAPELDNPIVWVEVYAGLSRTANNKAGGLDGLTYEMLRHAGVGVSVALTALYNHVWVHGVWPVELQRAVMVALYKGDDSRADPNSYRMLSQMSVIAKVFEKVLDGRIRKWSERTGALSDLQGGFRGGRGTEDQMFILNEIAASKVSRLL